MVNRCDILTIEQVADLFRCSVRKVDDLQRCDRTFPKPIKIGKRRLWRRVDLDGWFQGQAEPIRGHR